MKKFVVWLLILAVGGYFGAKWYLHMRVANGVDREIAKLRPLADIRYEKIHSTIYGDIGIEGVVVRFTQFEDPLFIERISIKTPDFLYLINLDNMLNSASLPKMPETLGLNIKGFRIPVRADYYRKLEQIGRKELDADDFSEASVQCAGKYGLMSQTMVRMGYSEQAFDLDMSYDQAGANLETTINLAWHDAYDADIRMTLADALTTKALLSRRYRANMIEGRLVITDRSLNARIHKECRNAGLSEEETRDAFLAALNYRGTELGIEFDEQILAPYVAFVNGKSTFELTANPNSPVSLSQIKLYKPSDVPALLNLEAQAY